MDKHEIADTCTEENAEKDGKIGKKGLIFLLIGLFLCLLVIGYAIWSGMVVPKNKYNEAMDAIAAKNYVQAYEELIKLSDYEDSEAQADAIAEYYYAECFSEVSLGDVVYFGKYKGTALQWTVVAIREGYAILACNSAVAELEYNDASKGIPDASEDKQKYPNLWVNSSLRTWLNDEFFNAAFGEKEKSVMKEARVPSGGEHVIETTVFDHVYLLSAAELEETRKANWNAEELSAKGFWLRGSSGTNGRYAQASCSAEVIHHVSSPHGVVPVIWVQADANEVLEESVFDRDMELPKPTGNYSSGSGKCSVCNGRGKVSVKWYSEGDWGDVSYTSYDCTACGGDGRR